MRSEEARRTIDWRSLESKAPESSQAELLLGVRTSQLARLRDLAWRRTGRTVTFSRNVTIPITKLCRNRCHYCGFRNDDGGFLRWPDILPTLQRAQELGCCEALFMSGERPEEVHVKARRFLKCEGFDSTCEYVAWLCGRTLDETELLPHTNIGVLGRDELEELKAVNASLGLMLEDASERLGGAGMPHENSPGKLPAERIRTIEEAGRLRIPFTTGLLVGIGQTNEEIVESLMVIKRIHGEYGHVQEVIIQRFVPKPDTPMGSIPGPSDNVMMQVVSTARLIFGHRMNLQVPPNIEKSCQELIKSGANDLGGISPVTRDQINPEEPWCSEDEIFKRVSSIGCRTRLRPPVYAEYAKAEFLPTPILSKVRHWLRRMKEERRDGSSADN